jgi:hypothetical protein
MILQFDATHKSLNELGESFLVQDNLILLRPIMTFKMSFHFMVATWKRNCASCQIEACKIFMWLKLTPQISVTKVEMEYFR